MSADAHFRNSWKNAPRRRPQKAEFLGAKKRNFCIDAIPPSLAEFTGQAISSGTPDYFNPIKQ
jgi:hypothetical protein